MRLQPNLANLQNVVAVQSNLLPRRDNLVVHPSDATGVLRRFGELILPCIPEKKVTSSDSGHTGKDFGCEGAFRSERISVPTSEDLVAAEQLEEVSGGVFDNNSCKALLQATVQIGV